MKSSAAHGKSEHQVGWLTRRVFLTRAAGLTLTLGQSGLWQTLLAAPARNPYTGGVWLAGDHHIHTRYSPDGQYQIGEQVANAARYGLKWCVITDHGGPRHDKVALDMAYPDLVAARRQHPEILVFQGLEWNIPAAEHGSVILPPSADEAQRIANFEALYDEVNLSRENTPANTEADAVAGVKYLQSLSPKPLFMANHPARRGFDSPHELRAWSDAGKDVARGFEGTPGHQAGTLNGNARGGYDHKPDQGSWPGYPEASYHTWGGYDWYVAKVGGLWDSLLGEGRPWYITADSDSHRHWDDLTVVDTSTYLTQGHVTPTDQKMERKANSDFYPGEYTKTWVYAPRQAPLSVLDAMRAGNMFTVLGDLIDRLELWAQSDDHTAPMGGTLHLKRAGQDVDITIRVRMPAQPNFGQQRPALHHLDLIAGDITGPVANPGGRDAITNPTTKVVAQLRPAKANAQHVPGVGTVHLFQYRFPKVLHSFYIRLRGTNTDVDAPRLDTLAVNPWDDLWFYSNPVMVRIG